MPDESKFAALQAAGYRIPGTCLLCKHSNFAPTQQWGTCNRHLYGHGKHTGAPRGCSIVSAGSCPDFVVCSEKTLGLGAHSEFLPGGAPQELPPSKGKKPRVT